MRLSERDFASELGRNLLIYPFRNEGVDSSSYSLTASGYAWKLSDKKSAMNNDAIVIPAKESVLVVTNETVSLQKYLCGLCCCGVSLATKGAIVNTTPIKCGWIGKLIITIHNPTDNQIKIDSGDKIAVLLVDRLRSSTKKAPQNTNHKTTELLAFQGFSLTDEAKRYINDDNYSDVQNLRDALKGEKSYQEFRKKRRYKNLGYANWAVPSGTRGTVKFVDDSGQLHPIWDNGRTLAIVPEVDIFRKLTELELQEEQEFKQQDQGEQRDFLEVQSL